MKIPDNYRIINTLSFFNVRLILPVVLLILCFIPLVAHASVDEPWPKTTKACDSIVDRLERLSGYVVDEQMELVSQLYNLGKANPGVKAIAWRALYWDAVSRHDRKEIQHALALIKQAESAVDRKRFGYDYMRIRRSRMLFELGAKNDLYGLYSAQYADLDYFMRIGDKKGIGSCHLMIGKVLIDIGEPLRALGENEKAVAMFRESDTPALLASAEMNTALCHLRLGEISRGLAILEKLERGEVARRDSFLRATAMLNISYAYSQTGKECPYRYIKWMEEYSRKGSNAYFRNMCNINVASWLYRHGDYGEAMALLSATLDYTFTHDLGTWRENCYLGLAQCLIGMGDSLGAVAYFQRYFDLVDSLRFSDMKVKILRYEEVSRIRRFDEAMQAEKAATELRYMHILAGAALLLLVLGCVCLWYWYKNKRAAMRLLEEQMDNERKRLAIEAQNRKIAISTIEMEEKNNTLRHIGSMVDDAKGKNEIGTAVAGRIKAQVKVHLDTEMGWDMFRQTFENVYPFFFKRIKTAHPTLTEYDIRLCTYILVGVDNKQIAMLLNVLPDSLKKSRTRLRKKLGIDAGVNLAEYLRAFNV
ncbi:tetratricopeptide repeat protein [Prevotella sp. CAG:1058]|nr:tetratricopeptide repeat protein [Prevotella sp. CAG:1058]